MLDKKLMDRILIGALEEDMPFGDITTDSVIDPDSMSKAKFLAKEEGIIAGMPVAEETFALLDPRVRLEVLCPDGTKVKKGDVIAWIEGPTAAILKGERTALNLLQRLSGIATRTHVFASLVQEYPVSVADTRKTTPGLRYLEKYAVRVGGGQNHRFCLSDGVMLKDNHIAAAGGIYLR